MDFLNKLSSYNIFNYLLPGIIFAALASKITHYSFIQNDILVGVFLYYFIGMVVSRFGSLVLEPLLNFLSIVKYANYNDFVCASKKDDKIELLSEVNNTYRTFCSLFILLLLLKLYEIIEYSFGFMEKWSVYILWGLILIIFLLSYRKQTNYITKRIEANR